MFEEDWFWAFGRTKDSSDASSDLSVKQRINAYHRNKHSAIYHHTYIVK